MIFRCLKTQCKLTRTKIVNELKKTTGSVVLSWLGCRHPNDVNRPQNLHIPCPAFLCLLHSWTSSLNHLQQDGKISHPTSSQYQVQRKRIPLHLPSAIPWTKVHTWTQVLTLLLLAKIGSYSQTRTNHFGREIGYIHWIGSPAHCGSKDGLNITQTHTEWTAGMRQSPRRRWSYHF